MSYYGTDVPVKQYRQVQIDTSKKIFEWYYEVRIPTQASRSLDDIREKGTIISGIPEIDRHINDQWTNTWMTIDQMAEYFKHQVMVYLRNPSKDAKDIYDSVSAHIHAWKQRLEKGVNLGKAPIEDLVLLDMFANSVYEHAKYNFREDEIDSLAIKHLLDLGRGSSKNIFNKEKLQKVLSDDGKSGVDVIHVTEPPPERDSLADFFKRRAVNMKKFGR